uniref:Uncharacterized protein n=1 Tax=Rhizophora mucronata TaxID=61149 RepID=A0A2P2NVD9_RHIMU
MAIRRGTKSKAQTIVALAAYAPLEKLI